MAEYLGMEELAEAPASRDAQEPQPQTFGGLCIGWSESTAPAMTLQAWFRKWRCGPLGGPVSRVHGCPLIKLLLEPSVQAAGEDHPTDLKTGYPNTHRSHEQQVVSHELFQLGHTASLYLVDVGGVGSLTTAGHHCLAAAVGHLATQGFLRQDVRPVLPVG